MTRVQRRFLWWATAGGVAKNNNTRDIIKYTIIIIIIVTITITQFNVIRSKGIKYEINISAIKLPCHRILYS